MNEFVIYVRDTSGEDGYYTGKHYQKNGKCFPAIDSQLTDKVKRYTSRLKADSAAEIAFQNDLSIIEDWEIKTIEEIEDNLQSERENNKEAMFPNMSNEEIEEYGMNRIPDKD